MLNTPKWENKNPFKQSCFKITNINTKIKLSWMTFIVTYDILKKSLIKQRDKNGGQL